MNQRFEQLRLLEALIFASREPVALSELERYFPESLELPALLEELAGLYANRGVNLVRVGDRWAFRTATDLGPRMRLENQVRRKLSRAAVETLAIVAYHQPITRAEIEEIRGVGLSRGTLDVLLEAGWIRPRGRKRVPGRPVTWGTSRGFLDHFGLESLDDLPGVEELKAAGLLDKRPALTALSARGLLTDLDDADDVDLPDEEETEESEAELLAADFGDEEAERLEADAGEGEEEAERLEAEGEVAEEEGDPSAAGSRA